MYIYIYRERERACNIMRIVYFKVEMDDLWKTRELANFCDGLFQRWNIIPMEDNISCKL